MEILRQPPFPLSVTYTVPDPLTPYILEIYDDRGGLLVSYEVTSNAQSVVTKDLPLDFNKFDQTCSLYVYTSNAGVAEDIVVIDTLYIYRPYFDPNINANTQDELEVWTKREKMARMVIDTMTSGFYYKAEVANIVGNGGDFITFPRRLCKVNYVYKNNVLVFNRFDTEAVQDVYYAAPDHTAITVAMGEEYRRVSGKSLRIPLGASDSFVPFETSEYDSVKSMTKGWAGALFADGADYVVYAETGWPVVPLDIKAAAELLMDDIACGKMNYVERYVTEYQTDQFKLKYGDLASKGTGNATVDKLLSQYSSTSYNYGVL